MASRFTELYRLPQNLYCAEAPVVVAAGVLLKDNESGSVLAQLKFKSIFAASIKALKLKLSAFDVSGAEVRGVDDYQYLDLAAKRGQYFGEDKAILLPDPVARSFSIAGISVIFVDGTAWELSDGADLAAIPEQKTLVGVLGDKELAEQYQREVNSRAVNVPTEYLGIWRCACGEINRYETCTKCGAQKKKVFAAMDASALQKGLDAHLEKERQKAEEKARLEAEKAELKAKKAAELKAKGKKAAKMGVVAAVLVAVIVAAALVVTKVVIPSGKYNDAVELMESGSYTEAIAAFEALGGYKDSVAKIEECNVGILDVDYNKAIELMEAGSLEEAYSAFLALGDHRDSATKAVDAKIAMIKDCEARDYITFGAYEQDGDTSNGKEEIEWFVLTAENDKALVISRDILDSQKYNETEQNVTWETCTLRKWLNDEFMDMAFSDAEKERISVTSVPADKNPDYDTDSGNATQDQVFLLSVSEVNEYLYFGAAFVNGKFTRDVSCRKAMTSDYAFKIMTGKDGRADTLFMGEGGGAPWWLRTPGRNQAAVTYINADGEYNYCAVNNAFYSTKAGFGVRPAMWIDLSA